MAQNTPWMVDIDGVAHEMVNAEKKSLGTLGSSSFVLGCLDGETNMLKMHGVMFQLSSTLLESFSLWVPNNVLSGGTFLLSLSMSAIS